MHQWTENSMAGGRGAYPQLPLPVRIVLRDPTRHAAELGAMALILLALRSRAARVAHP